MAIGCCLAARGANPPAPAAPSKGSAATSRPADSQPARKFPPVTTQQARRNRQSGMDMFEQAQKDITKDLHLVETEHFLIFSAWKGSNDKPLGDTCEQLYKALCKQFDVGANDDVWAGKLAMFVFNPDQFVKFAQTNNGMEKAAGYCSMRGNFAFVVLKNTPQKEDFFFEALAHETTHVFTNRYLTNRPLPTWLAEGISEMMVSTLLPRSVSARRVYDATKQAAFTKKDISGVFESVELNDFDYGIAHSLVDYLIARDRKAFLKLVALLKDGQPEADALKESYNLTREQLVNYWTRAARTVK